MYDPISLFSVYIQVKDKEIMYNKIFLFLSSDILNDVIDIINNSIQMSGVLTYQKRKINNSEYTNKSLLDLGFKRSCINMLECV